jgi:hypothetical protein
VASAICIENRQGKGEGLALRSICGHIDLVLCCQYPRLSRGTELSPLAHYTPVLPVQVQITIQNLRPVNMPVSKSYSSNFLEPQVFRMIMMGFDLVPKCKNATHVLVSQSPCTYKFEILKQTMKNATMCRLLGAQVKPKTWHCDDKRALLILQFIRNPVA